MVNHYKVLGVPNFSSVKEVRKAYIAQIRKYHPDVNKSIKAEEISKVLNVAKEALETESRKAKYDRQLQFYLRTGSKPRYNPSTKTKTDNKYRKTQSTKQSRAAQKKRKEEFERKKKLNQYKKSIEQFPVAARFLVCGIFGVLGLIIIYTNYYVEYESNMAVLIVFGAVMFFGATMVAANEAYKDIDFRKNRRTLGYNLDKRTTNFIIGIVLLGIFSIIIINEAKRSYHLKYNYGHTVAIIYKGHDYNEYGDNLLYGYFVDGVHYVHRAELYDYHLILDGGKIGIKYAFFNPNVCSIVTKKQSKEFYESVNLESPIND